MSNTLSESELVDCIESALEMKSNETFINEGIDTDHKDKTVSAFLKFLVKIRRTDKFTLSDLMQYMEMNGRFTKEAHIAFEKTRPIGPSLYSVKDFLKSYPK